MLVFLGDVVVKVLFVVAGDTEYGIVTDIRYGFGAYM